MFVRSIRRVHHDSETDVPPDERDATIESVEYSDGFGRLLQTRTQAEDTLFGDPVFGGGVSVGRSIRYRSRHTVGHVQTARRRRPTWSSAAGRSTTTRAGSSRSTSPSSRRAGTSRAPTDAQLGQKATMFYDPRGQADPHASIPTARSSASSMASRPISPSLTNYAPRPGKPTPTTPTTTPAAPTATRPPLISDHWNTPASIVVDALGRTVDRGRAQRPGPANDWYRHALHLRHSGQSPHGHRCAGTRGFPLRYDLAKRRWRMDSIDAGRRDTVPDASGNPIEGRDSQGRAHPASLRSAAAADPALGARRCSGPVTLRQRMEYGDGGDRRPACLPTRRPRARRTCWASSHATTTKPDSPPSRPWTSRATCSTNPAASSPTRRSSPSSECAGQRLAGHAVPGRLGARPATDPRRPRRRASRDRPSIETTRKLRRAEPRQATCSSRKMWKEAARAAARLQPCRRLGKVWLDDTLYVERIAYDAKGQRALIAYGNGVMTRYAYDPQTFRLKRLRSERYTKPDAVTYRPAGAALQDYGYDYDLVGNILAHPRPHAGQRHPQQSGSGNRRRSGARATARRAAMRSIAASTTTRSTACSPPPAANATARPTEPRGRTSRAAPISPRRAPTPSATLRRDGQHAAVWSTATNRAVSHASSPWRQRTTGCDACRSADSTYDYAFDANGNMRSETTSRHFEWNHADQMKAFRTQTEGAEPSVHAHYLYDAAGQRVKKLVRKQGGQVEVTHYIDAVFEHHRWGSGAQAGENNHVHVMDDKQRIALVRLGTAHPDDQGPAVQFHLGDHLGSSNVVVDASGALVNREEFTPYGETSFGSFARKRYRFTGMERDEESGLNYHGTRYCAPWLARWTSTDPLGPKDGLNVYWLSSESPADNVRSEWD